MLLKLIILIYNFIDLTTIKFTLRWCNSILSYNCPHIVIVAILTLAERKIMAAIKYAEDLMLLVRYITTLADGLKLLIKELLSL